MKNFAVILASGNAVRMSGIDKMIGLVAGKPLVSFSIEAFLNCKTFDQIYVTVNDSNKAVIKEIVRGYSSIDNDIIVIPGGIRRQDSVKNALDMILHANLDMILNANIVAVHDGARPLLTEKIIAEGLELAIKYDSAIPVVPIEDTIKEITPDFEIIRTLERSKIYRSQTPQFFNFGMLYRAHKTIDADMTDDAAMVEKIGHSIKAYPGDRKNLKITVPEDILVAEAYLDRRSSIDRS